MNMSLVTCKNCRWVSFAVSRKYAEDEVKRFNAYFDTLSDKQRQDYYGGRNSSVAKYVCLRCGGNEFAPSEANDCPNGCTINPVIYEPVAANSVAAKKRKKA